MVVLLESLALTCCFHSTSEYTVPGSTLIKGIVVVCLEWLLLNKSFLRINPYSSMLHVLEVKFKLNLLMFIVLRTVETNCSPLAFFYFEVKGRAILSKGYCSSQLKLTFDCGG